MFLCQCGDANTHHGRFERACFPAVRKRLDGSNTGHWSQSQNAPPHNSWWCPSLSLNYKRSKSQVCLTRTVRWLPVGNKITWLEHVGVRFVQVDEMVTTGEGPTMQIYDGGSSIRAPFNQALFSQFEQSVGIFGVDKPIIYSPATLCWQALCKWKPLSD